MILGETQQKPSDKYLRKCEKEEENERKCNGKSEKVERTEREFL